MTKPNFFMLHPRLVRFVVSLPASSMPAHNEGSKEVRKDDVSDAAVHSSTTQSKEASLQSMLIRSACNS